MANYRKANFFMKILIFVLICSQETCHVTYEVKIFNDDDKSYRNSVLLQINNFFYWISVSLLILIGFILMGMLFKSLKIIKFHSLSFAQHNSSTINLMILMTSIMFTSFIALTVYLNFIDLKILNGHLSTDTWLVY